MARAKNKENATRRFIVNTIKLALNYWGKYLGATRVEVSDIFALIPDARINYGLTGERSEVWAEIEKMEKEGLLKTEEVGIHFFVALPQSV